MSDEGEERVGYGRPPAKSRFKPGQSGNVKGRPKGAKSFATVLQTELNDRVAVNENGRRKRITKRQIIGKQLVNMAASGDLKAITSLLTETRVHESEAATGSSPALARPEDRAVMEGILNRIRMADAFGKATARPETGAPEAPPEQRDGAIDADQVGQGVQS